MISEQQINNSPVVDWELATKLAGNKTELAKDLLRLFVKSLPQELSDIRSAKTSNDITRLQAYIHKLHGAACYCGIPRLQHVLSSFETALKTNQAIDHLHQKLEEEAQHLMEAL